MDKARNLTSSLLSMVTRSKRSTPKKKPARKKGAERNAVPKKKDESNRSVKEEKEVAGAVGDMPTSVKGGVPAQETLMESKSTLGDDSVLAQISPALSSMTDDDYEKPNMTDIDGESKDPSVQPPTNDELYREQIEGVTPAHTVDEGDIYRGHATLEEQAEVAEEEPAPVRKGRGSPMLTVGLVVLAVILFLAASGGVYMFVGKGNTALLPDPIAALFGGDDGVLAPTETRTETASSSVGLIFVVSTTEQETAGGRPFVLTRVLETDVEITSDFEATGIGESTEGKAKGTITVINETGRQFTFVVTTRFFSEDGVLFRLNRRSVIAADGETDIQVTADVGGAVGDVGPTGWIIPGLSASLQEVVWGRSAAGMTGGSGTTTIVSVDDLADAKVELEDLLWEEAESNFQAMRIAGEELHDDLYVWEELSLDAPEEGVELSSFEMGMGLQFRVMVIPYEAIAPLMVERLSEALPEGASAVDYELGTVSYTIEAYDIATETAVIRAEASIIKF